MSSVVAKALDLSGVAVITGGAAGFGREAAARLVRNGMNVALLDVSASELEATTEALAAEGKGKVLAVRCNVADFAQCTAAAAKVQEAFPGQAISFLFNNAGIAGKEGGAIMSGPANGWPNIFSVNVFGAVHIIKAFLPIMIQQGPLPSGKKAIVATTSSVVGVLNHNIGPYSVSKMAVTAMGEQLALELEGMGQQAAHIAPCMLLPTVCGTDFLNFRGPDGSKAVGDEMKQGMLQSGGFTAVDIIDGLFKGFDEGR